ncbi:MAG: non-canonical purine NTP diphosphatase [Bacteroides sp.]|nr:non-canonical purine NTP diphosphatase [Bacteroides sp.]
MKPKLVFATNNLHKLNEVSAILVDSVELLNLKDIGCETDIPETGTTLEENALIKAEYIYKTYGLDCFADDTGLEIEVLNNAPGVYSARYAGEGKNSEDNMQKVLLEMKNTENRKARFRTVIALIRKGEKQLFEGIVNGEITGNKAGTNGFGYDPVFVPEGYIKTFAELSTEIKNSISHRAIAVQRLCKFLLEK